MKQNVLAHLATIGDVEDVVVLTHDVDFLFIQSVVLPELRRHGSPKLTILADAGRADDYYARQRDLVSDLGRRFRVVRIAMPPGFRFHPKAILLSGRERAALAVGNGNATYGGWSGNAEAWMSWDTQEDGTAVFSAFRDYLETLTQTYPITSGAAADIMAAFNPAAHPWEDALAPPAGLVGRPGNGAILDRLAGIIPSGPNRVDVVSPFYDEDGEALQAISQRFQAPVRVLLQRGRAGLTRAAAANLRELEVSLASVDAERRFIHAKVYAFHYPETVFLAVGSANCSRAALTLHGDRGNAELVAVREVPKDEADAFLGFLEEVPGEPDLPTIPPQETEEAGEAPSFRILAASYLHGRIEILVQPEAAKTPSLACVFATGPEKVLTPQWMDGHRLVFACEQVPRSVRLHAVVDDVAVESPPCWMDDEGKLSIKASLRRFADDVSSGSSANWSGADLLEIAGMFVEHLDEILAKPARVAGQGPKDEQQTAGTYTAADIFVATSRPSVGGDHVLAGHSSQAVNLGGALLAMFGIHVSAGEPEDDPNLDPEGDGEPQPDESRAPLIDEHWVTDEEDPAKRHAQAIRAIKTVMASLDKPDLVRGIPARNLARFVGFLGVMLWWQVDRRAISADDFYDFAIIAWRKLYGPGGILRREDGNVASAGPCQGEAATWLLELEEGFAEPAVTAGVSLLLSGWRQLSARSAHFDLLVAETMADDQLGWLLRQRDPREIEADLRACAVGTKRAAADEVVANWQAALRAAAAFDQFHREVAGQGGVTALCRAVDRVQLVQGDFVCFGNGGRFLASMASDVSVSSPNIPVLALATGDRKTYKRNSVLPVRVLLGWSPSLLPGLAPDMVASLKGLVGCCIPWVVDQMVEHGDLPPAEREPRIRKLLGGLDRP